MAFRGKLPGENWLIGYACGYGRTSARNTYITELSQVLSSITGGRYLEDVLREVHSKVKAIASDQNPEYLTNLSRDIYLSPASKKNPTLPRCKTCPSCTRLVADSARINVTYTGDSSSSQSERSSIVALRHFR